MKKPAKGELYCHSRLFVWSFVHTSFVVNDLQTKKCHTSLEQHAKYMSSEHISLNIVTFIDARFFIGFVVGSLPYFIATLSKCLLLRFDPFYWIISRRLAMFEISGTTAIFRLLLTSKNMECFQEWRKSARKQKSWLNLR